MSVVAIIGLVAIICLLAIGFGEYVSRRPPQGIRNNSSPYYQAVCVGPISEAQYELCQQRRMADSTEDAVKIATWQAALSLAGLLALLITVVYTAISANAAAEAARAAQESVAIAKQQLNQLERPYVFIVVIESGIETSSKGAFSFAGKRFTFACSNYGRSPAILTEIYLDWQNLPAGQFPEPIDPAVSRGRELPSGIVSVLGNPYSESESLFHRFNDCLYDENAWHDRRLFFIGYVAYRDLLGNQHIAGLCSVFDPLSDTWVLRGDESYNYQKSDNREPPYLQKIASSFLRAKTPLSSPPSA